MRDRVTIVEVGPRDGLQNEARLIPSVDKIKLVDLLSDTGLGKIEVTSFVSPKWVPQMADATEVLGGIVRKSGVIYAALTPNLKGYEGARAAKADEIAIFASASEGFSQKNINCSIAESIERFREVAARAKDDGLPMRGYVSCVTDCPYDGPTPPESVARVTKLLLDLGCTEVSLGDTIGVGTRETVDRMLSAVLGIAPAEKLAGHFHDTKSNALDNIEASLARGLRTFDAAAGGLGGCPYAPGAAGNVATGAVVRMLAAKGYATGIDLAKLDIAEAFARSLRGPKP